MYNDLADSFKHIDITTEYGSGNYPLDIDQISGDGYIYKVNAASKLYGVHPLNNSILIGGSLGILIGTSYILPEAEYPNNVCFGYQIMIGGINSGKHYGAIAMRTVNYNSAGAPWGKWAIISSVNSMKVISYTYGDEVGTRNYRLKILYTNELLCKLHVFHRGGTKRSSYLISRDQYCNMIPENNYEAISPISYIINNDSVNEFLFTNLTTYITIVIEYNQNSFVDFKNELIPD